MYFRVGLRVKTVSQYQTYPLIYISFYLLLTTELYGLICQMVRFGPRDLLSITYRDEKF